MEYYPWDKFVTCGSYFTYKGIKYGRGTVFRFTADFYNRIGKSYNPHQRKEQFDKIVEKNGEETWHCGMYCPGDYYENIVPDRDIWKIVEPVFYFEPKELVKKRLKDGTWINYIWSETLFYVFCLLISPILQQWYLIWTIGLYAYLRIAYIKLSSP